MFLGWEVSLAAYSYLIDGRSEGRLPNLADGLFFLVVNPTLVFTERGHRTRAPGWNARGALRIGLGLLVSYLGIALTFVDFRPTGPLWAGLSGYALFLAQGLVFFVARYSALSGIASVQLGAMRLLGWEIPERYDMPFLARSPSEFWRRWNTYLTGWFQRYAFVPLVRHAGRVFALDRRITTPLAAMATLIIVGLYHDLFMYLGSLDLRLSGTAGFAIAALLVPSWALAERVAGEIQRSFRGLRRVFTPLAASLAARGVLVHGVCAVAWAMLHSS